MGGGTYQRLTHSIQLSHQLLMWYNIWNMLGWYNFFNVHFLKCVYLPLRFSFWEAPVHGLKNWNSQFIEAVWLMAVNDSAFLWSLKFFFLFFFFGKAEGKTMCLLLSLSPNGCNQQTGSRSIMRVWSALGHCDLSWRWVCGFISSTEQFRFQNGILILKNLLGNFAFWKIQQK